VVAGVGRGGGPLAAHRRGDEQRLDSRWADTRSWTDLADDQFVDRAPGRRRAGVRPGRHQAALAWTRGLRLAPPRAPRLRRAPRAEQDRDAGVGRVGRSSASIPAGSPSSAVLLDEISAPGRP
jgi:hypothetical protein